MAIDDSGPERYGFANACESHDGNIMPTGACEVPVLIIGGGPAGLTQALLLAKLGVRCLVAERYPQRLAAPKAHALSPRSLEICRQFGLDTQELRRMGTQRKDAYWVNFVTDLSGEVVGVLPYERMDPEVLNYTPEMIHNIPQPAYEQYVADQLAKEPLVEIRKGHSFVSLSDHSRDSSTSSDSIITLIEDRAAGINYEVKSRHVIACDGAKSRVRAFLGIECDGEETYESMMTIHFNADLRPVVKDRVGMLHWIMDPEVSGFVIGYDLSGNQVLIHNFDAKKSPVCSWTEEKAKNIVRTAIGQDVAFDILSFRPWLLSRRIAKEYRLGNVFLAGDAAHSFPPTGGLGLNSGLGDVHNLAFKIAAVHHGWATDGILDTYGSERRHVAVVNSLQSVKNGKKIFSLLKTLGTAETTEQDIAAARKRLYETIHDPNRKKAIEDQIEEQREHFDNLELHIGYVYNSKTIPPHASSYTPKYTAGARLPHAWITILVSSSWKHDLPPIDVSYVPELASVEVKSKRYSTLDLCTYDAFTLIVSSADDWSQTIASLEGTLKQLSGHFRLNVKYLGKDFLVDEDKTGSSWIDGCRLRNGGGVVVRPDQHILMVLEKGVKAAAIVTEIAHLLGWSMDVVCSA